MYRFAVTEGELRYKVHLMEFAHPVEGSPA